MARYSVPFTTWASTIVDIEVPDDVTDPTEIVELAERKLYDIGTPDLCHQCSGGGRGGTGNLSIGDDDWAVPIHNGAPEITRTDH